MQMKIDLIILQGTKYKLILNNETLDGKGISRSIYIPLIHLIKVDFILAKFYDGQK